MPVGNSAKTATREGLGFEKEDTDISVATIGTTNSTLAPKTIRRKSCRECDLLSQE